MIAPAGVPTAADGKAPKKRGQHGVAARIVARVNDLVGELVVSTKSALQVVWSHHHICPVTGVMHSIIHEHGPAHASESDLDSTRLGCVPGEPEPTAELGEKGAWGQVIQS